MAHRRVVAQPALVPGRIVADALWRQHGKDHPLGLVQQPLGVSGVVLDALHIELVGVLAHRQVHRPGQTGQVHIGLHLGKVLRFGAAHALGSQVVEALGRVGLELQHMPGLGCFRQTQRNAVERTAKVATVGLHTDLAPGFGVDLQHRGTDAAQVPHQPGFFQLAGLKQAQEAPGMAVHRGPAKVEPQGALAVLADQGGPEVRTKAAAGLRFVGREDRVAGGAAQGGQFSHGSPPGGRAADGHARAAHSSVRHHTRRAWPRSGRP